MYTGDATRLRIRVGRELTLTVKQPNRAGEPRATIGSIQQVGWRHDDVSVVAG